MLAGAAISLGPKNMLGHAYFAAPIGITVEGANILTRTLIIFGQGAIRCHPYVLDEIHAIENKDIIKFDRSFWGHVGHVVRNLFRAIVLTLTRGWVSIPPVFSSTFRYYQKIAWVSAVYAFFSDIILGSKGGALKRMGRLTGQLGDILSWMYLGISVLKRFEIFCTSTEDTLYSAHIVSSSLP